MKKTVLVSYRSSGEKSPKHVFEDITHADFIPCVGDILSYSLNGTFLDAIVENRKLEVTKESSTFYIFVTDLAKEKQERCSTKG